MILPYLSLLSMFGGPAPPAAPTRAAYVDPSAGTLLLDLTTAVDPSAGTLILAPPSAFEAEAVVDPSSGTVINL